MDVSIIIVNYHSAGMVIDCVNSIREKTENLSYEIIVVDNASGDDSTEILQRTFGNQIILIASEKNLGFGKANNLGAKKAAGKYLFLLNPDTTLVNNAIKILYDYLEQNSGTGIAGGNLYSAEMRPAPSFCKVFDDLKLERKRAAWPVLLGNKLKDKVMARRGKTPPMVGFNYTEKPQAVAYIFGADMMLSRKLFEQVGGFDPDFFMYAEEEELSWRITQEGYNIVSVPQAKIVHLDGATVKKVYEFSTRQFKMRMNGTLIYYKKRFGDAGAAEFYRLRSLRYQRLMTIAKLQRKLTPEFVPAIQLQCLDEVYQEFISER